MRCAFQGWLTDTGGIWGNSIFTTWQQSTTKPENSAHCCMLCHSLLYVKSVHKYIKTKLANTIWDITQSCLSDVDYCALFASSVECNYSSLPMFVEPPWISNYSSWMHWCDYLFMSQSELTFCKSGPRLGLCCSLIKEWVAGKGGHTGHVSSALTGSIR